METLSLVQKLWGSQPKGPALPRKRPSESSEARAVMSHASSLERALHLPPKPPAPAGHASPTNTSPASTTPDKVGCSL